jgi:hypothetical protein
MRIAVLAFVLVLVPRLGVAELDSQRDEVRRCLEATAAAASSEDLNAYIECFDARLRPQIRKTAGLRFAQFDVGVSIEDCHVLSSNETTCDVAVRYTTHLSGRSFDFLSVLTLKRVDDQWKIRTEKIRAWQESTVADSLFPYGGSSASTASRRSSCSSGSCSLSGR